jgi:hypothetical protein
MPEKLNFEYYVERNQWPELTPENFYRAFAITRRLGKYQPFNVTPKITTDESDQAHPCMCGRSTCDYCPYYSPQLKEERALNHRLAAYWLEEIIRWEDHWPEVNADCPCIMCEGNRMIDDDFYND